MKHAKVIFKGALQAEELEVNPADSTVSYRGKSLHVNDLPLQAPINGTVYGTLLNYKGALEAMGDKLNEAPYKEAPKAPVLYIKPYNTISGNNSPIPLPAGEEVLEVGAALAVVIGKDATRVSENEALDYVSGYTIVNDVSIPHESVHRPAIPQKCRDGFCPVGPWVIEKSAIENPDNVTVSVYVNGEKKQENNTKNLVRSVAKLIADVTDFMTLQQGDVLLVGVAENAPLVKLGDSVRIEIEGVGALENTVVHEEEVIGGNN